MSMAELDDPDFVQLRRAFLAFTHTIHAQLQFEPDPLKLCSAIGLPVRTGAQNLYTRFGGHPVLQYNSRETTTRRTFSLWHEISHHFFQTADDGFQVLLEERYGRNSPLSVRLEEELCNESAGQFQMPDAALQEALKPNGLDPRSAISLAMACHSSLEASMRRVADAFELDSWILLAEQDGRIVYTHTRTRFPIRTNTLIPSDHALHQALLSPGLLECREVMPFPHRTARTPKRMLRAINHRGRIAAIFADRFPQNVSSQKGLFDD